MELTHTQREILLLAAESGGRPTLPPPDHIAGAVNQLMQAQMLVLDDDSRVVIADLGRAALAEIPQDVIQEDRKHLGFRAEIEGEPLSGPS